jgi:2-dehydropantoate 2-reductase
MIRHVAVVGAGGLGSKFAARLAGGVEVTVVPHGDAYIKAVQRDGLVIQCDNDVHTARVNATRDLTVLSSADVVLVAVKSYDTETVAVELATVLSPDAIVLTLQNGLGNAETLVAHLGGRPVGLAVTTEGATLAAPGVVLDKGRGHTILGLLAVSKSRECDDTLIELAKLMSQGGLPTEVADDVEGVLWAKLAMAAGINPVAVVLRVTNGALREVAEARELSTASIKEVMAVAAARGITLAFDPLEAFERTTTATASMSSGSLLDSLRGRRTEIAAISGAIAREATAFGVAAPVNTVLAGIVAALEATADRRVEPSVAEPSTSASHR